MPMGRKLLLLIVMMSALASYSQTALSGGMSVSKSDTIKKKVLDHSKINVIYRYSFSPDAESPNKKKQGFTSLLIGDRYNLFQDYYKMKADSVQDAIVKRGGGFVE